jgi:hypothetical protein
MIEERHAPPIGHNSTVYFWTFTDFSVADYITTLLVLQLEAACPIVSVKNLSVSSLEALAIMWLGREMKVSLVKGTTKNLSPT